MAPRRTEEDLLNPGRLFYRLIDDYRTGRLSQPWIKLYRARVEVVDREGGRLETIPVNPPNSIRARVYSGGLDANLPSVALSVFHPLFPAHLAPPIQEGEHVYVIFEDEQMSHGLWISPISSYHELNFADPDARENNQTDISSTIDPAPQSNSTVIIPERYGGLSTQTNGRPQNVDNFENANTGRWAGKRVVLLGDSQVRPQESPSKMATILREKLTTNHRVASFNSSGRVSWGVQNWLSGRGPRFSTPQPQMSELIRQYNADAVIIILGGNDYARNYNSDEFRRSVESLWRQTEGASIRLWAGPPQAFPSNSWLQEMNARRSRSGEQQLTAQYIQERRQGVSNVIRGVIGDRYFLDSIQYTNEPSGRDRMGVHFVRQNAPSLEPWSNAIIRKAAQT